MHAHAKRFVRRLRDDISGVASIEFAFIGIFVVGALANAADFGLYEWRSAQVSNAAQLGAQSVLTTCAKAGLVPATTNCPSLASAVTSGIQSTQLGSRISLASGSPSEGYYCLSTSGATSGTLVSVGSLSAAPSDCSSVGSASAQPGDYIIISVTTPYATIFQGLSVMSNWGPTAITKTSWIRLQ